MTEVECVTSSSDDDSEEETQAAIVVPDSPAAQEPLTMEEEGESFELSGRLHGMLYKHQVLHQPPKLHLGCLHLCMCKR